LKNKVAVKASRLKPFQNGIPLQRYGEPEANMRILFSILSIFLLAGCAFVKVNVTGEPGKLKEQVVAGKGRAKIAVVDISGVISLTPFGLDRFSKGPPLVPRFKEELERIVDDDKMVGVVVRIDSPGGSVTASDILYHELRQLREKKKIPIVACIMDKGFSGGYYAALAADEIMAHPTSVLGGVGVISFKFNIEELLDKWGIEINTVQSGPLKDFWSPLRPSRPEETALMQAITDRLHGRFLQLLNESRQLSPEAQQAVATGRIFGAEEALEIGLLDRIGYLDDAVARIRELTGVQEARVILSRREGTFAGNVYAAGSSLPVETVVLERGLAEMLSPVFRYQYLP
jgi:protease-4